MPILAGGTGLYIKAIVENLEFPIVPANQKLRAKLEKKTIAELFEMYIKLDEEGSKIIDKNNKRRLIRAIEVSLALKESFFKKRKKEPMYDVLQIGINIEKDELDKRIRKRVDNMIKQGLEKEVKKLSKKYRFNVPPMQTIGYREWESYFNKEATLEETIERIKINTIKFAKRQMTWFKKDKTIKWI
jgi:tRNA dimethylallyltransferase